MINQEWKIKTRAAVCCVTGRPFEAQEPFFTAIFEDETTDGFVRRDYSSEAWERDRSQLRPFSYWRSLYEPPAEEMRKEVVEKESAEGLLRRLIEEEEPATENARFILALMLERRKTLRETDSKSLGDARLRIYEHSKTGEVFIIRDPMLRLDQIEALQKEVAELLASRAAAVRPLLTNTEPAGGSEIPIADR
ncbi:MAG: hypothetical protein ACR2OZ_17315 [Verrucomicrobiales bacterium]